ncbi:MAG TPA: alpha/beta hydrolase [Bacteroidales bacterium]|nr:alpha/beta hydrolase [Bacteroidales bacterium]HPS62614.1 alpha/beta hydrolase [Bacteroidales bacterium]
MPSTKSKIINFLLRNRHLMQGKCRKEVFTMDSSIAAFREQCEQGAARFGKIPDGVTVKPEEIRGIKAEWLIPAGSDPARVILYVHGGGYVSGSCSDHRGIVAKFALRCGVTCLVYEYRLAPEHPYPAALDDSVAVYSALLNSGFLPHHILVAGESAGGGLTLALLLALKERAIALPAGAVALSPWTDLTCSGDSYHTKNRYSLAPMNSWTVFSRHYAGNHDPADPFVSPLFGNPAGLPPLYLNAGTDDELFDDGARFAQKAKEAGVDVTWQPGERQVHCYPLLAPMFPEATEAMEEVVAFVKRRLAM